MPQPLAVTVPMAAEQCYKCGIPFMMPEQFNRQCREHDGEQWFYCPRGHRQHYQKSECTSLREQLARTQETRDWWERKFEQEQNSHRATKGQVTKLRKRVGSGVCPCCNRQFANLKRHMASKHPDYSK